MTINTLTQEGQTFVDSLVYGHEKQVWNEAIETAIKRANSIPVFVDTDGDSPDDQREASTVKADILSVLSSLKRS